MQVEVDVLHTQRKRTASFSYRTESVVDLAAAPQGRPLSRSRSRSPTTAPCYKDQRNRRCALLHAAPTTPHTTLKLTLPSACSPLARTSDTSGLSPPRALLLIPAAARTHTTCGTGVPPGSSRPSSSSPPLTNAAKPKFKRSPSTLHRRVVLANLREHGVKMLHMGARPDVGILGAAAELERMCAGPGAEEFDGEGSDDDAEGEDEESDFHSYSAVYLPPTHS